MWMCVSVRFAGVGGRHARAGQRDPRHCPQPGNGALPTA